VTAAKRVRVRAVKAWAVYHEDGSLDFGATSPRRCFNHFPKWRVHRVMVVPVQPRAKKRRSSK
jgi:hypothetical protein